MLQIMTACGVACSVMSRVGGAASDELCHQAPGLQGVSTPIQCLCVGSEQKGPAMGTWLTRGNSNAKNF